MSNANLDAKTAKGNVDVTETAPVLVDIGKHKAKAVKGLRKGTGKLMDEIQSTISDLRAAGTISLTAQPVIIIVTEKRRPKGVMSMLNM